MITHQDVVDRELAEAYLDGTLGAADRAAFEEHYFACDECFAALEATGQLREGIRHLGRNGELSEVTAAGAAPTPRAAVLPWLAAAATLLLAAGGGWTLESRVAHLERELGDAHRRANGLELAMAQTRPPAPAPLALAGPEANVPLALLQTSRSAGDALVLAVPATARHFVIWLEDAPRVAGSADLVVVAADGRIVHTLTGLTANGNGAIVASFPTDSMAAGTYSFRVTVPGRPRPLAEYRLTLTRPPA